MPRSTSWWLALSFSCLLSLTVAAPSPSTVSACKALEAAVPNSVAYPDTKAYTAEINDYWNIGLRSLKPACIILPTNTQAVAATVKLLNKPEFGDVKFAVKSGGHDPNPGHASIKDGVLVAMNRINGTEYDAQKGVAYVKPGGDWADVITPLAKFGVTVVGGRLGVVGIGGYLLQGGISFLSAQYGFAADNVVAFETVMANGSIVNITPESNADLMVAMRGSGGQFGIVTRFTLKTYPIGKVWGGRRVYLNDKKDEVFAGLHDFLGNPRDPKAAVIVNTHQAAGQNFYMVFYFYDGPTPPKGAFGKLEDIKASIDITATTTYPELLNQNSLAVDDIGMRASFRSITLPFLPNNPELYKDFESMWKNRSSSFLSRLDRLAVSTIIAIQPFPASIGKATAARGGNAMGFTENDGTRFVLEINCLWPNAADDEQIWGMSRQLTEDIQVRMKAAPYVAAKGVSTYNPYFANDAGPDQDVFSSYKDVAKFRALQKQNDPNGLWSKRSGGYKY